MMRAADLKEAQQIVDSLAWLDKALSMTMPTTSSTKNAIVLQGEKLSGYSDGRHAEHEYPLTPAARVAAHKVMIEHWQSRRAHLIRRAAQIGLTLEKKP